MRSSSLPVKRAAAPGISKPVGLSAPALFSKENGVNIFLKSYSWLMSVQAAVTGFVLIILLMRLPFLEPFQTKQLHKSLHDALLEAYDASNNLIIFTFTALVSAFSCTLLKYALEDGQEDKVKKYFNVLAVFVAIDAFLQVQGLGHHNISPISVYFELPRCALALGGVALTHSFIIQKRSCN